MKKQKNYHKNNNISNFRKSKERSNISKTLQGVVRVNSRGVGYITNPNFKESIEIESYFLRFALNGDEVLYAIHPQIKGKSPQGEIVDVLKRNKTKFSGTVEESDSHYFLDPDDKNMYRDIIITNEPNIKEMVGKKVLVEIISWKDYKKNPVGKIVKVFGNKGEHEAEIQSIIFDKGFESSFSKEVENEAQKIKNQSKEDFSHEINKRKDLRQTTTFTIDPKDAKDFDDAISFKKIDSGYEIGIHIADVSHYVKENSLLDREAKERGFSIYLVDRTVPMLPEILSNDLCSLNPNEDKLAYSAILNINSKGHVSKVWFGRTVINSDKRFSYEEAQKILDNKSGNFYEELNILNNIAKELRDERFKKGAIDFDSDEVKFELDEKGSPIRIFRKTRLDTHKLIEEFMLLANRKVAEYASKESKSKKGVFVYRIHDLPNKEKIENLSLFLKAIGYNLPIDKNGVVSSRDLNLLFEKIENKPEESLIKTAAVRTMSKAEYSVLNKDHFGLAFKNYTHFTSPIRRYADLLVHRLLDRYLNNEKFKVDEFNKYKKLATEISEKEIRVTEAERESIRLKQVEYMSEHKGEVFDGVISGISEWGIYVEEVNTKSEGLIRLRDLEDDFYELDQKNYCLIGKKTKKKFQLGKKVKVKVKNVDIDRKFIDYVIEN